MLPYNQILSRKHNCISYKSSSSKTLMQFAIPEQQYGGASAETH
jgi:hypothetical protein